MTNHGRGRDQERHDTPPAPPRQVDADGTGDRDHGQRESDKADDPPVPFGGQPP